MNIIKEPLSPLELAIAEEIKKLDLAIIGQDKAYSMGIAFKLKDEEKKQKYDSRIQALGWLLVIAASLLCIAGIVS